MAERIIGYIVSFVVLAGMGWGLSQWFEWRRSLINQLQRDRKDARQSPRTGTSVSETSERERTTLRDAAYMIGIGRVAEASRLRGWV